MTVTASWTFTASPANASGFRICEASGNRLCVNAPTLALYDPVVQSATNARNINIIVVKAGTDQVLLQIVADTGKCVAAANNGHDVVLHKCSGGNGVIWHQELTNGVPRFESNEFSGKYLAGDNVTGHQFQIRVPVSGDGFLYRFETAATS